MAAKIVLIAFSACMFIMLLCCTAEGYFRQREKNRWKRCHDVKRVPLDKKGL